MTFYMIGIGLGTVKDITVRGLDAVKSCSKIYLEYYTSIIPGVSKEELEDFYGKEIILATRDMVEKDSDKLLSDGNAFLVIGDVFGATTHTDLYLRAKEKNLNVEVINNASILNVVGNVGLELYKFGKTTSMVFFDGDWKPRTAMEVYKENQSLGLHTLVLLDIKVAEPKKEDIMKGSEKIQPPRFMTVNEALGQFLELGLDESINVIGCARLGTKDTKVVCGTAKELIYRDFGEPVHCLIIPGKLHFMEENMLNQLSS